MGHLADFRNESRLQVVWIVEAGVTVQAHRGEGVLKEELRPGDCLERCLQNRRSLVTWTHMEWPTLEDVLLFVVDVQCVMVHAKVLGELHVGVVFFQHR